LPRNAEGNGKEENTSDIEQRESIIYQKYLCFFQQIVSNNHISTYVGVIGSRHRYVPGTLYKRLSFSLSTAGM
jgi:hypothetical protein